MKNKKGFTLVELVIVIAVIAILAGVLIGTFATVISRANQSKAMQEIKAKVDEAYVEFMADYHTVPGSINVELKQNGEFDSIQFGQNVKGTTYEKYVVLTDGYIKLNDVSGQEVYLIWKNNSYSVTTSISGDLLVETVGTTAAPTPAP